MVTSFESCSLEPASEDERLGRFKGNPNAHPTSGLPHAFAPPFCLGCNGFRDSSCFPGLAQIKE